MTWVTVQSHDIGDTFLGHLCLGKSFRCRKRGCDLFLRSKARASRSRLCVLVWDQSQERLQVVAALSSWRIKGFGGSSRRPRFEGKSSLFVAASIFAKVRQAHPRWGAKSCGGVLQKSFPWNAAHPGGEHLGALAGGAAFGEEAPATGAARTGLA